MKTLLLTSLLTAGCLLAADVPQISDPLTTIDSSRWSQAGSLSVTASGVTGSGTLLAKNLTPGMDYDSQVTIHSAEKGACDGAFSLFARSNSDNSTGYVLSVSDGSIGLMKLVSGARTVLSWMPFTCSDGSVLRLVVHGGDITTWSGPNMSTYHDSAPLVGGQPGIGIATSDAIADVKIRAVSSAAPPAVAAARVESSVTPRAVLLRWPTVPAAANGPDISEYAIYRDGVYMATTQDPEWADETVSPNSNYSYSIVATDQHGNSSRPAVVAVSTGAGVVSPKPIAGNRKGSLLAHVWFSPANDQRRVGVRSTGSYWGGAGEQIDTLSGNLNFTVPLVKALGRGGWSVNFVLSYNSQFWRQDVSTGAIWNLGKDVGYGLGWKLQAGSLYPAYSGSTFLGYLFTDATGAEYLLDQQNGTVWSSQEGVYLYYDTNTKILHFTDGSFWKMNIESSAWEQDAGTLYPSVMQDSNGNTIEITYAAGLGSSGQTSARIVTINDSRIVCLTSGSCSRSYGDNYYFNYNGSRHLTSIVNNLKTAENYTFAYTTTWLTEPFTGTTNWAGPSSSLLQSVTVTGLGIAHQFVYGTNSGELTQMTTPLGGKLEWDYVTKSYGTTRKYREVQTRYMTASPGGTRYQWNITTDTTTDWHTTNSIEDVTANAKKYWTFDHSTGSGAWKNGLLTRYQEEQGPTSTAPATMLVQKDFSWTQTGAGSPYVSQTISSLNPGTTSSVQSKTTQTLDNYGNLTQSQLYDYPSGATLSRTYNVAYLHNGGNPAYATNYIFNRPVSATLTPAAGSAITLFTKAYDFTIVPSSVTVNHNPAYNTGMPYRGTLTQSSGLNGTDTVNYIPDTAGIVTRAMDSTGAYVDYTTSSATNYSLPEVVTPNSNTNLQTSATYASSFAPISMTGPNGASGNTTYDSYGRPTQTQIPEGATTTYSYSYGPPTQTATVNGRYQKTTLDGFGRPIRVEKGNATSAVSWEDTEYAPCACSPLGKLKRTSLPYAASGSPSAWTTYTYDGSGRTLTVTVSGPSGSTTPPFTISGTTTYSYAGNVTTVSDPAGKTKSSKTDAFGNLVQVTEDPSGLNYITNYTYNSLNRMTQVSMTRGATTQTRTFVYTGSNLTSETHPENGTTTYAYDTAHRLTSRIDNSGQETRYSYDSYGRRAQIQHWISGSEDLSQRVDYSYDGTACPLGTTSTVNAYGRLTAVLFHPTVQPGYSSRNFDQLCYQYSYNTAGHVLTQKFFASTTSYGYSGSTQLTASYAWDNEGRMTSMAYPNHNGWYPVKTAGYQYDANGRMNVMTWDAGMGGGPSTFATAAYGTAGEMLQLSYGLGTETRTYNSLLQLTNQVVPGYMNMQYNYSSTANDGKITVSVDAVAGESTSYSYDGVNRLVGASNSLWSTTYGYDGFGNLTSKTGSGGAPSMTASYNSQNRQTGASYDGNGNQTSAPGVSNSYDGENRLYRQVASASPYSQTDYGYDPSAKRVLKRYDYDPYGSTNPQFEIYFYSITGQKIVTLSCPSDASNHNYVPYCFTQGENAYFGGKQLLSNGLYVATDRLGSVRANNNGEQFSYYPYGEERTSTVDGRDKFGTYFRDSATQDYAMARYYGSDKGRFWSADPAGRATANTADPESMNRYAYTKGDPVNRIDPLGLYDCDAEGINGHVCPALADGSSSGYGLPGDLGCTLDGMPISCSMIHGNAVVQLPSGVSTGFLPNGWEQAVSALTNPACASLFGMGSTSPITLLGQVQISVQPMDPTYYGATYFPTSPGNPNPGQYTILINSAHPEYNLNGGADSANTLIHELLHVAVDMGFPSPNGWLQLDGSGQGEPGNNNLITNSCGLGPIWP